uniref:ABC transporter permease n=1 Tax=Fervidobacterium thailandense TaxID=1008305 RepID=A0A7C4VT08_9BACT
MRSFIIKRLLLLIPIFFGVSVLCFLILYFIPGVPAKIIAGEGATKEDIENIRVVFGLDKPLYVQYLRFLRGIFTGELRSIKSGESILKEIAPRYVGTIQLAFSSIIISSTLGILLGVLAAVYKNSWIDNLAMAFALIGASTPVFWLGLLLILVFAVYLKVLPSGGREGFKSIILPALTLGLPSSAIVARLTRASMLDALSQDYIRTALAYGIPKRKVIFKYALKNALIPVVTVIGLQFGFLLSGAVLTESVFGWPGVGRYIVDAVFSRDYVVIEVGILITAMTFVLVNTSVDLLYAVLDPRLRKG